MLLIVFCIYEFDILFVLPLLIKFAEKFKKAFQSVLPAQFILCYNLLQVFLSLIFALMRIRNMREKDIIEEMFRWKLNEQQCKEYRIEHIEHTSVEKENEDIVKKLN